MDNDSIVRRLDIEGDGLVDQDSIETSSDIVGDVFVEENYLARRVEQQRCLLSVAIDFGTTFSGYAFSFEADFKRDPLTISASQWKAPGHLSLKTPTSLLLSKDKSFVAFGYEAEKEYTNLAIEDKHHEHFFFKTFKMQLYQNKKGCEVIEDINGKILPSVTVFAESIEYLKGHFRKKIQAHGDVFTINEDEIRWVLTVPAIWDDFAKNVMRQAAIKAGIPDDNLILALEPEAASIYCQHLYTRRDQKQFDVTKEGTKFMVLDLGGGTADITVQEKLQDGKLREIRRATGGPFGGSAVNDAFIKLLGNIVGSDVLGKFKLSHMYDFIDLLGSFELEKRFVASKSNTSNKFNIRVPVSLLEMIEIEKKTTLKELIGNHSAFRNKVRLIGDKLSIDENIIRDMFVGVMNEICKHVSAVLDTQEGNEVSLIQMVGGFSESQCVQEIIREKFQSKNRHVLVPQEAGIAVLKGAVIFGHSPNSICSRIIRYTYGNAVKVLFQDGVHDERKRWNDGQKVWCQNVFKPFMKAGTSVEIGHSFVQRKPTSHYETARMKIYVTDNEDIMYVTDEGCRELCNVLLNEVLPSDVNLRQTVKQTIVFGGTDLKIRIQNENTRQSHRMSLKMDVEKEEKEEEEFQQTRL